MRVRKLTTRCVRWLPYKYISQEKTPSPPPIIYNIYNFYVKKLLYILLYNVKYIYIYTWLYRKRRWKQNESEAKSRISIERIII